MRTKARKSGQWGYSETMKSSGPVAILRSIECAISSLPVSAAHGMHAFSLSENALFAIWSWNSAIDLIHMTAIAFKMKGLDTSDRRFPLCFCTSSNTSSSVISWESEEAQVHFSSDACSWYSFRAVIEMELGISKGISFRTNVPKARESGQRGLLMKEVVLVIFVQLQELFTNVITALL